MEVRGTLTANSPDKALGVVSAVVIAHENMMNTCVVSGDWTEAEARVASVWFIEARVITACEERKTRRVIFVKVNITRTQAFEMCICFR